MTASTEKPEYIFQAYLKHDDFADNNIRKNLRLANIYGSISQRAMIKSLFQLHEINSSRAEYYRQKYRYLYNVHGQMSRLEKLAFMCGAYVEWEAFLTTYGIRGELADE